HVEDASPEREQVQREKRNREAERDAPHVANEAEVVDGAPEEAEDQKGDAGNEKWHPRWRACPEDALVSVEHGLEGWGYVVVSRHGSRSRGFSEQTPPMAAE